MHSYFCKIIFIAIYLISSELFAAPSFLTLPFTDPDVKMQQAPIYSDAGGTPHWGGDYPFDYAKGVIDNSSTWESFDVRAAASGVAIQTCQEITCEEGYGRFVLIRHDVVDVLGRRYFTLYSHLESASPDLPYRIKSDLQYGDWKRIEAGQIIGKAGQSGKTACASSSCIHLHFEVFRGGYFQNFVDPYDVSTEGAAFNRDNYPPIADPGCGVDYLWSQCPPVFSQVGLLATDAGGGNLISINTATGQSDIVGNTGISSVPSLATNPSTGVVYAGSGGGTPFLYSLNTSSGVAQFIGDSGLGFAAIGGPPLSG